VIDIMLCTKRTSFFLRMFRTLLKIQITRERGLNYKYSETISLL